MNKKYNNYVDFISRLYYDPQENIDNHMLTRNITLQVTDDCPMACTYCYQINKGHKKMSFETAKKAIDLLFDMYEKDEGIFINKKTKAIILDFIGGEPLMAIDVIDDICTYFMNKCIELNHPWAYTWKISLITNGALYFDEKVQNFLKKFHGFISFSITIDGPKEIHDACRVYHDGRGNFDDAYAAAKHFLENYHYNSLGTKVTIAPENLHQLNTIVDFFINEGINDGNKTIFANTVHEAEWTVDHAKLFYVELKKMADRLLALDKDIHVSLFDEDYFVPMDPIKDDGNWCGGTGNMLAFDPDGLAYPCIRYMPSSLGNKVDPIIVGNVDEGIFTKPEWQETKRCLDCITRRSQSTDECFYCPIAKGCSWCSAWNYQLFGTPDKRCTNLCIMHKARSLANVYYWNKKYAKDGIDKKFYMYLPKEEALKIINEDEYQMLLDLSL